MFAPGTLPRKLTYQTVKDTRQVIYNFPVPNLDPYFREKPGAYVANLLGHEGAGSLHAQLKARGWIESLGASAARFDADNALVMVSIELTEEGSAHVDDITQRVVRLHRADPHGGRREVALRGTGESRAALRSDSRRARRR